MDGNEAFLSARRNHRAGNIERAEYLYREILRNQTSHVDAAYELGNILYDKGCLDEAVACYKKAIETDPQYAAAYHKLGEISQDKGQFDEAVACYKKAIRLYPDFAGSYYNLAVVLEEKRRFDEAVVYFRKVLELSPRNADTYNHIGNILKEKELFAEAIKHYKRALRSNPLLAEAHNNLGLVFRYTGELDKSIKYYQKALRLNPNNAEIHFGLSLALLLSGDFQRGWKEYEWRWKTEDFIHQVRNFPHPLWDGIPLAGKKLFVFHEQGIGDEIMFASCLPDVTAQADLCVVECTGRLVPLFSRSFPEALVTDRLKSGDAYPSKLPPADMKIAIGSLPGFFRLCFPDFPERQSYLVPDARKTVQWRQWYRSLGDSLKVGISWRGGSNPAVIQRRSIRLEQWSKLFSVSGVDFINLQYGECSRELREAHEKTGVIIHHWPDADPLKDLDDFAAQVAALDLVISVDNATVHMAGALGVKVWTLLPFVPDWRWMLDRENSPWYPSMRLFRQPSPADWESVMERTANELQNIIGQGNSHPANRRAGKSCVP